MDQQEVELIDQVRRRGWTANRSLVEQLSKERLLATAARLREANELAREVMLRTLERETAEGLVRAYYGNSRPTTAAEMLAIMRKWIEDYRDPEELYL